MVTIVLVGMIMYTTKPEIQQMGCDDQQNSRNQQPVLIFDKELLQDKENNTGNKQGKRKQAVMMFSVTMKKRIGANTKSQPDHPRFKSRVMNNIDAKKRQTA